MLADGAEASVIRKNVRELSGCELGTLRIRAAELSVNLPKGPPPNLDIGTGRWHLMEIGGNGDVAREVRQRGGYALAFNRQKGWNFKKELLTRTT